MSGTTKVHAAASLTVYASHYNACIKQHNDEKIRGVLNAKNKLGKGIRRQIHLLLLETLYVSTIYSNYNRDTLIARR